MKKIFIIMVSFFVFVQLLFSQTNTTKVQSALTGTSSLVDSFDILVPKEKYTILEFDASRLFLESDVDAIQGDNALKLNYQLVPYNNSGSSVIADWEIYPSFDFSKSKDGSIWVKGDGSQNIFGVGFVDSDDEVWVVKNPQILSSMKWSEFRFKLTDFYRSSLGALGNHKFDTTGIKGIYYFIENNSDKLSQGSIKIDNFTFTGAEFPAEVIERKQRSLISSGYVDIEYRKINNYFPTYASEFTKGDLLWNLLTLNMVYRSDFLLSVASLRLGGLDFGLANERYGIANSFQSDFTVLLYLRKLSKYINFIKIGRLGPYFNDYILYDEYAPQVGEQNHSRTGHFLMGVRAQGQMAPVFNYDTFYIKQWHDSFIAGAKTWMNVSKFRLSGSLVDYDGKGLVQRDENHFDSKLILRDLAWTTSLDASFDSFTRGFVTFSAMYGENDYNRYGKIYQRTFNEYTDLSGEDELTNDIYFRETRDFSDFTFMRDRDLNNLYEPITNTKSSKGQMYRASLKSEDILMPGLNLKIFYENVGPKFLPMFRNKEIMRERLNILFFNQRAMYGGTASMTISKFKISGSYVKLDSNLDTCDTNYYHNGNDLKAGLQFKIWGQTGIGVQYENLNLDFPNILYNQYREQNVTGFFKFAIIRRLTLNGKYQYIILANKNSTDRLKSNITKYGLSLRWDIFKSAFLQFDYTQLYPIDTTYFNYVGRGPNMYEPQNLFKVLFHIDFSL